MVNASYTKSKILVENPAIEAMPGDDMTMVPKYNFYVALDQEFSLYDHDASVRIDLAGYGENKSHFKASVGDESKAYAIVSLSGNVQLTDNASLSLYVENLFNKDYTTYKRLDLDGAAYHYYGTERMISVRLDFIL